MAAVPEYRITPYHSLSDMGNRGVLEMIRGEPSLISGVENEVSAQPLVGYRKPGKSFTEGENKREIKGQIRVAWS